MIWAKAQKIAKYGEMAAPDGAAESFPVSPYMPVIELPEPNRF
ncbi:hypothetical protein ETAE_p008 (plasmid) [Edwardsiella piscicida]|uniref:Uncharacterized protein n=1 Tax=Edwardsiella piscicida TaxID=1263550 RepID=A0AAU8PK23_EDWPI|nr:hypothetical protein ETAE_p008 [Edwardsiella tarda EIB202]